MKKIFVLTLVFCLMAITVIPAYAADGKTARYGQLNADIPGKGSKAPFALSGIISSLDPTTGSVTVTVACGNKLVKSFIGHDLTIQTTVLTRFLLRNPDGRSTPIAFNDLVIGQKVSVNGVLANNIWTANRITVGADLLCVP